MRDESRSDSPNPTDCFASLAMTFWWLAVGIRFTVHGSLFTVHGLRFTVHGLRFTVYGSRFLPYFFYYVFIMYIKEPACLKYGQFSLGKYEFTFHESTLSSGIFFADIEVDENSHSQKLP